MLIEGIFAAITTPFYPDERVYYRKLEANLARYSRSLLAGVVILGSTGEAVMLSDDESHELLRVVAEATTPEKVLIAGIGRDSVHATLELADTAARCRYDAVLVRTPTYFSGQMTPDAVFNYFSAIADRSPLPVLLYNIPKFVPYQIPIDILARLAHHPNIIGVKDSSGDVQRLAAIVEATRNAPKRPTPVTPIFQAVTARMLAPQPVAEDTLVSISSLKSADKPENSLKAEGKSAPTATPPALNLENTLKTRTKDVGFQVLSGSSAVIFDALKVGASGAILAAATYAPQACQNVYVAWKDNSLKLAETNQQLLIASSQRIIAELGINAIKYACDYNGYFGGYGRAPMIPLTNTQKAEVEALLAQTRS